MSRSYKKTPGWTDQSGSSWMKKYANRRFRRFKGDVQNGKWYRKYTNPWDICDYKFLYWSEQEVDREVAESGHTPKHRYYMK